ncbi:glycosyltransferase [Xylophilus sp. Kf1]|nr:glycosyltransferase [Xylophilus sp. Kf1]
MGGFEGADHVNGHGVPLDINRRNGHAERLQEDYLSLVGFGIRTVRESIGWRLTDMGGAEALDQLHRQATVAAQCGVQVIWTLMHYGWPAGLDPFERPDDFVEAFGEHCARIATLLSDVPGPAPIWQPVNEISFLAWAASSTGLIHPHLPSTPERGHQIKRVLVRAALRAMDRIRAVQPGARFIHTDPLVNIAPPLGAGPEACEAAARISDHQYEAWDMLAGRLAPELGGAPHYLDILGINYYHDNQWDHGSGARFLWHLKDPRRRPFARLAEALWLRYRTPMCISETGHIGEGRDAWLDDMAGEIASCRRMGVPLAGICLYPVIDRPDWQTADHWHHSGLWDVPGADRGDFTRHLCLPYARRLRHWQQVLASPSAAPFETEPTTTMTPLIVFCHLRWDFVYQRPQQLMSRLASARQVVFVEEPIPGAAEARLETYSPCDGVTVLRMHLPSVGAGFHDAHVDGMRAMLRGWLADRSIDEYLLWFYTPMALPLAQGLSPRGMVYDCMDELAAFDFAPPELIARENALFDNVDLVFTGGRSLYESKRGRHDDVHCFPSSVDHAHFGRTGVADHPDQAALAHPRLGYYGVIDERLDLDLVAALADAHADWQVVMVGPLAKITPESLPRRANLHWMGQRRYDELPAFLAGWDVCLLPFALNASTRFISPTKTLEYLAAGKAAVSTPIRDVAEQYAQVVPIAATPAEFVAACEVILGRTPAEAAAFAEAAADTVSATSWDRTAGAMQDLLRRFDGAVAMAEPEITLAHAHDPLQAVAP